MYFVFKAEVRGWRNQPLQAKLQGDLPSYHPHWWDCQPVQPRLPQLTFAINSKAPLPDNFFTGMLLELYSDTLIRPLREAEVPFETFPASVIDQKTRQLISSVSYQIFHLLELHPGLDQQQSEVDDEELEINKLVLTETCLQTKRPLFRLKELPELVLIHQDLKAVLEEEKITGCHYIPVNEFRSGVKYYFEELTKKADHSGKVD